MKLGVNIMSVLNFLPSVIPTW